MFGTDERGQAIQVGAILLFAFLVIGFSSYQAVVVPQQNERAEFEHAQAVQEDITAVRSAVLNSAFNGEQPSADLRLGTRYPFRLFAINPGPVGGTVQTTGTGPVDVSGEGDVCPGPEESRQLTYSANYRYLQNPPGFHVENTVSYRQYGDRAIVSSGQKLVNGDGTGDNDRINLVPIRKSYSENGIQAMSVEFTPGLVKTTSVSGPFSITVPTQLSEGRWEGMLKKEGVAEGDITVNDGGTPDDRSDDILELTLSGDYTVICTPVGVGGDPPNGVRDSIGDGFSGDGGGSGGTGSVNPAGPDAVVLQSTEFDNSNNEIDLTFRNKGDEDRTFSRARVAFYYEADGNVEVQSLRLNNNNNDEFIVGDSLESVDETVVVSRNGGTTTIMLKNINMGKDDLFELGVEYNDGSQARYFVDVADQSGGGLAPRLPNEVVYVDSTELVSIGYQGDSSTSYSTTTSEVKGIGPKEADIDSDSDIEIPYVDGSNKLSITGENNGNEVLADTGNVFQTHLAVGNIDDGDGDIEVLFIGNDNKIKQIDATDSSASTVTDGSGNAIKAVNIVGYEDFNGDGDRDIIYVTNNNKKFAYLDDGTTDEVNSPKPPITAAVGQPADFDGDGDLDIPFKNDNMNDETITFVDASGVKTDVSTDKAVGTGSIATVSNTVGSSSPDVVYINKNNGRLRIIDLSDGDRSDKQYDSGKNGDEDAQSDPGAS